MAVHMAAVDHGFGADLFCVVYFNRVFRLGSEIELYLFLRIFLLRTTASRVAGDHLYGKWLFTWLSLVNSLMVSYFVLSFFPRDVLGEICD